EYDEKDEQKNVIWKGESLSQDRHGILYLTSRGTRQTTQIPWPSETWEVDVVTKTMRASTHPLTSKLIELVSKDYSGRFSLHHAHTANTLCADVGWSAPTRRWYIDFRSGLVFLGPGDALSMPFVPPFSSTPSHLPPLT